MKKLFLVLVLCLCSLASWAQTFSDVAPTGQTLYYNITSPEDHTVEVTYPGIWFWEGFDAPTGDLTIPNTVKYNNVDYSVTAIGNDAFNECSGLTSVIIPNSVTSIGVGAFILCSGLTNIVIGSSVNSIESNAFRECRYLKTVYWLCSEYMNPAIFNNLYFGGDDFVCRVIRHTALIAQGLGNNITYLLRESYFRIVDIENDNSSHIPYSSLPTNFIGKLNGSNDWVAREIVLTDGQDEFEASETFTADTVTYTREFADGHRSTLYLPFTAAIPEDLEVYEFSDFDGSTLHFSPSTDSIRAYTPYLVGYGLEKSTTKCVISQKNAKFPATTGATPAYTTTHGGMTFQGTLVRTGDLSTNNYGYKDGFFVQSGGAAHVNPFRCYFTYTGGGAGQMPPHTLSVAFGDGLLGIDAAETPATNVTIRHSNDVYDLMGRLVRKDAATLDGLPTGIYVWKGRKVLRMK